MQKMLWMNLPRTFLLLGHPHGDFELRQEIARYLYHSRGVDCTPEQVIIGSGTEQLMPLVIRILGQKRHMQSRILAIRSHITFFSITTEKQFRLQSMKKGWM